ncbi:hypothetical protein B0H12DRAFT_298483 [Mycena haematopus]|nr:hypothetical protein B0H12DRAFT_298483 [Mycena haematopus]
MLNKAFLLVMTRAIYWGSLRCFFVAVPFCILYDRETKIVGGQLRRQKRGHLYAVPLIPILRVAESRISDRGDIKLCPKSSPSSRPQHYSTSNGRAATTPFVSFCSVGSQYTGALRASRLLFKYTITWISSSFVPSFADAACCIVFLALIFGYIYYRLALGYLNTRRDLRRMESNSRSPIY